MSKFATKNGSKYMIYQVANILLTKIKNFNVKIKFM